MQRQTEPGYRTDRQGDHRAQGSAAQQLTANPPTRPAGRGGGRHEQHDGASRASMRECVLDPGQLRLDARWEAILPPQIMSELLVASPVVAKRRLAQHGIDLDSGERVDARRVTGPNLDTDVRCGSADAGHPRDLSRRHGRRLRRIHIRWHLYDPGRRPPRGPRCVIAGERVPAPRERADCQIPAPSRGGPPRARARGSTRAAVCSRRCRAASPRSWSVSRREATVAGHPAGWSSTPPSGHATADSSRRRGSHLRRLPPWVSTRTPTVTRSRINPPDVRTATGYGDAGRTLAPYPRDVGGALSPSGAPPGAAARRTSPRPT